MTLASPKASGGRPRASHFQDKILSQAEIFPVIEYRRLYFPESWLEFTGISFEILCGLFSRENKIIRVTSLSTHYAATCFATPYICSHCQRTGHLFRNISLKVHINDASFISAPTQPLVQITQHYAYFANKELTPVVETYLLPIVQNMRALVFTR